MIDREFYRLSTLTTRWKCEVEDLIHMGIQDRAQICINIFGTSFVAKRKLCLTYDYPSLTERYHTTDVDMPPGIFEIGRDTLRSAERSQGMPFSVAEAYKYDHGWEHVSFDPSVLVGSEQLCVLHAERVRLDREEFGIAATPVDGVTSPSKGKWPWGNHDTQKLRILAEAAKHWWVNYDPADATTAPTVRQVADWLVTEKGVGKGLADAMAAILRADGLKPGPRT